MNSSQRLAASRYAAAYDALSRTDGEATKRAEELSLAAKGLAGVASRLTDPGVPLEQKKQAVRVALEGAPHAGSFVEVLLEAKRYNLLPEIVRQVQDLLDKRLGVLRARVVSAHVLDATEQANTVRALETRYGKQIKAVFQTDETLLGGLKTACNGELIDGSLSGELGRLQEELMK